MVDHVDRRVASWDFSMLVSVLEMFCIPWIIFECHMSLSISILGRLMLGQEVGVTHSSMVIACRVRVLSVRGYHLIVPAFRGIVARPLANLAKFVSVVINGSTHLVPFVLSAYHHCVSRKTTESTAWLLWRLCCLVLLGAVWFRPSWPHCLDKAWTVHNVVLRTSTSEALGLVHVGYSCNSRFRLGI